MKRSSLMTFSVVAHVAVAVGLGAIQVNKAHTPTAVELIDVPKPKPEPPKPPVEPPKPKPSTSPKPSRPRAVARAAAANPTAATPRAASFDGVPDFGVALSGTGEGLAIAVAQPEPEPVVPQIKALGAPAPVAKAGPVCAKSKKPTPLSVPRPEFPMGVRDFNGDGKVRIKLTIDEHGQVVAAEILSGMREEFNQAALAAARRARFEPGTQCGSPITASFTVAMRFSSG